MNKKIALIALIIFITIMMLIFIIPALKTDNIEIPLLSYQSLVEDSDWQDFVTNGETSGTYGENLSLKAIRIYLEDTNYDLGIRYGVYFENGGWQEFNQDNQMKESTDDTGENLEGIRIELTGTSAQLFDIYYQVHVENAGWMGWAKNGEEAGTEGLQYRLEAFRIMIVPAGADVSLQMDNEFVGLTKAGLQEN